MKIVILSGLYPPLGRGGAEKVTASLVRELQSLGHDVTVITTGPSETVDRHDGLTVHVLRPRNIFWYGQISRFPFLVRLVWHVIDLFNFCQRSAVKKILEQEKPNFFWTHNLKGLGFLIPRLIKKSGRRHVHTLHDIHLIVPSGTAAALPPRLGWYGRIMVWLMGSPAVVTSPSQWLLDQYQQFGFFKHSAVTVLPHVFDEPRMIQKNAANYVRFAFLGQLEVAKGASFLIEWMSRWQLPLIVAAGGNMKFDAKKSGIDYRGFLSGASLEAWWQEIDFLIVPSLILENAPTVILESFSRGIPVVASDIGGIGELVKDGVTGFLFAPGNHESLRQALKRAEAADYAVLGRAAMAQAAEWRKVHQRNISAILTGEF